MSNQQDVVLLVRIHIDGQSLESRDPATGGLSVPHGPYGTISHEPSDWALQITVHEPR